MLQNTIKLKANEDLRGTVEQLIREGRFAEAKKLLHGIRAKQLPRESLRDLANLHRRLGDARTAQKLLWPLIDPDRPLGVQPTAEETGEYAVALLVLGASQEAIRLLEESSRTHTSSAFPGLFLYLGFANMTVWNYEQATNAFAKYLSLPDLKEYERTVATVNLAASLIGVSKTEEAQRLLKDVLRLTSQNQWHLLEKNSLELSAQIAVIDRNWELARTYLDRIEIQNGRATNAADLFVKKWRAVVALHRGVSSLDGSLGGSLGGSLQVALSQLAAVRSDAEKIWHWETLRDCDFHEGLATKNESLMLNAYFGTPFSSYRNRIENHVTDWLSTPEEFCWPSSKSKRIFDLKTGQEKNGSAKLKPGRILHRTLLALLSDFYSPFSLGSLHSLVFPEEHFEPSSGPLRVRQVIARLRTWFIENDIPLEIRTGPQGFKLHVNGDYAILISRSCETSLPKERPDFQAMLNILKSVLSTTQFSSAQAAEHLQISERLARDLLRWGLDRGQLRRDGAGRNTRYCFSQSGRTT